MRSKSPHDAADEWIARIERFFKNKDLIYTVNVSKYDDADDDFCIKALKALSSSGMTLDVYVEIKVWNADLKYVMNGSDFGAPIRFYEEHKNKWCSIAETERTFNY